MREQGNIRWRIISYFLPFISYYPTNKANGYVCKMTYLQGHNTFPFNLRKQIFRYV